MSIPIFINGLLPNIRDKREDGVGGSLVLVVIMKDGNKLFGKPFYADEDGVVKFQVPLNCIGAEINISIRHQWYKPVSVQDTIPDYGYFYSAKLFHDYAVWSDSPSSDPEWETENEYINAEAIKNVLVRNQRHKNNIAKAIYYIIAFGSPVLGLVFGGILGVATGLIITLLLELLSPYAVGLKRI